MPTVRMNGDAVADRPNVAPFSVVEANCEDGTVTICLRKDLADTVADLIRAAATEGEFADVLTGVSEAMRRFRPIQSLSWALAASVSRVCSFLRGEIDQGQLQHRGVWIPEVIVDANGDEEVLRES